MKKRTAPRSVQSFLTRLLLIPILVLWLLAMGLITVAVANDMYHQLEVGARFYIQSASSISVEDDPLPGSKEIKKLEYLGWAYRFAGIEPLLPIVLPQMPNPYGNDDWFWGKWELLYGFQAAVAFWDETGELEFLSGDYLWFSYANTYGGEADGYAYIDLGSLDGGEELADQLLSTHPEWNAGGLQRQYSFGGYFEGNEFHPVTIWNTTVFDYEYGTEYVDQKIYQAEEIPNRALTVIRCQEIYHGYNYEPGPAFRYGGATYENAAQLLKDGLPWGQDTLLRSVIYASSNCDDGGKVTLALSFSPLGYATLRLLPCYLISGLGVLILLVLLLKKIRQQLTEPLAVINRGYENNRVELSKYADSPLLDLQILAQHFNRAQQDRHKALAQLQPLQTALDYARDGEEHRKKMVSAIAHELKTPLAIIHSYAEGLQTGIAKEKQDRYLSVILEETERMDALVLETLELSRLEAGKVRLSTDQFSLVALTREVFDRLAPALAAKQLKIHFSTVEEHQITADEARIHQVITNFATNAIKYSPMGGEIRIQIYRYENRLRFLLFNQCTSLSQEQLTQVWDTFYRTEESRTTDGTGLGLAIAKNIISLHRGECIARNAEGGVEFGFSLPL